ncbi:MAG TPA: aspartate kinase [Pyrinomonadaceae bacterium]
MATHITVTKFGGTSIQDGAAFKRVAQIVKAKQSQPLVVVVSAMSRVTDALIASFRGAATHGADESLALLEQHFERHLRVGELLSLKRQARLETLIELARAELRELLHHAADSHSSELRLYDAIVSHGERLAANLLTLVLEEHGLPAEYVDARRCVITNDKYGNAEPLLDEVRQRAPAELLLLVNTGRVPVLGGFIGATREGVTTTLGRGSSDYSATLIGAALHARAIEIWTDVDGIQTADPRLVKTTRTVPHVSYAEAAQLAKLGARVMHPKMIEPVIAQRIPIRILNSHAPDQPGTLISDEWSQSNGGVKAIAHKIAGESAIVGCIGHGLRINFRVETNSVDAVVQQLHAAIFE